MQAVRQQAWALAAEGRLVVTQVLNTPLVLICLRAIEIVPCEAQLSDLSDSCPSPSVLQRGQEVGQGARGAIRLRMMT